jgi:hypothetical protein
MKKMLTFLLLLTISTAGFSQQPKTDYLEKSKKQKTTAWVLLGGGVALGVGAAAWSGSNWESTGPDVLFVIAGASIIGSIPLFIASGKNKKKAEIASFFRIDKAPIAKTNTITTTSVPSIGIRIKI